MWNTRSENWSPENVAKRLYIDRNAARDLLQDLSREELIAPAVEPAEQFYYKTKSPEMDRLIAAVDDTYRKQLVRVSTLIIRKIVGSARFRASFSLYEERD